MKPRCKSAEKMNTDHIFEEKNLRSAPSSPVSKKLEKTNKVSSESLGSKSPKNHPTSFKITSIKSTPTLQTTSLETQEEITNEFKKMKTSSKRSIFELSNNHRVVCLFIKWFGCPM
jgi:hypothetical protein